MRTIIDLLKRGNQELFHSSIVGWFLDPKGEHRWRDSFLRGFLQLSAERSANLAIPPDLAGARVDVEAPGRGSRHDIRIVVGDTSIVVENKIKSVGSRSQLDRYRNRGHYVVPLGLTAMSFEEGIEGVVTYSDVLVLLRAMPSAQDLGAFGGLVEHYLLFLEREIAAFEALDSVFALEVAAELPQELCSDTDRSVYSQNDLRSFQHYLLESFSRRYLAERWSGRRTEKNEQSGVWLACSPTKFTRSHQLARVMSGEDKVWFHMEIHDGPFRQPSEQKAGVIQIRAQPEGSNVLFFDRFASEYGGRDDLALGRRPKDTFKTFYLASQPLRWADLPFQALGDKLNGFVRIFGAT